MVYDFKTMVNRKAQGAMKWQGLEDNMIALSVADIDFLHPPELIEGMKEIVSNHPMGYTVPQESYYDCVIRWFQSRHNFLMKRNAMVDSPGVVSALFELVEAFTNKDDGVIILSPVYHPFSMSIERQDRKVVEVPLLLEELQYSIDYDALEAAASKQTNKMLIFCSPHNPVGRVWTKEELRRVGEICLKHNVLVISDEIHCDIIMPNHKHAVMNSISNEISENTILAVSASKAFNLAGLQTAVLYIESEKLRERYNAYKDTKALHVLNAFGPQVTELAYNRCSSWLSEFNEYIASNAQYFKDFMTRNLPEIKVIPLEGTYLQWFDCSGMGMSDDELNTFLIEECGLVLDPGSIFGKSGANFQRINIACSREILEESLNRILKAWDLRKQSRDSIEE